MEEAGQFEQALKQLKDNGDRIVSTTNFLTCESFVVFLRAWNPLQLFRFVECFQIYKRLYVSRVVCVRLSGCTV
jgi:hypothetical protein